MSAATVPVQPRKAPRKDPRPRPVESGRGKTRVVNKGPDRYYVLVATTKNYGYDPVSEYESMGYRRETAEPGGPRLAANLKTPDGEVLQYQDSVLMSISLEEKADLDMFGPDGDTGWSEAAKIEEKIIDKRGAQVDLMRGLSGARGYVGVQAAIEPLRPDLGPAGPYTE